MLKIRERLVAVVVVVAAVVVLGQLIDQPRLRLLLELLLQLFPQISFHVQLLLAILELPLQMAYAALRLWK